MDVLGIGSVRTVILFLFLLSFYFGVCESQDDRSVRIVEGSSPRKGRVEIFLDEEWGTVTQDGFGDAEAELVCLQLGFNGPAMAIDSGSADVAIDVPVLSVDCQGETSLTSCRIEKTQPMEFNAESFDYLDGISYWNHEQNAGVECKQAETESNVITVIINVIGVLVAIVLICLFGFLFYRLHKKRPVNKEILVEEEATQESVAMYSQQIEKDYSEIPEDRAKQDSPFYYVEVNPESSHEKPTASKRASVNYIEVEPEDSYGKPTEKKTSDKYIDVEREGSYEKPVAKENPSPNYIEVEREDSNENPIVKENPQ